MHGKSRGLSDHVDYDKSDWLRCPQTQFKVRFTPRLQVRHGLPVRLSPNFQASTAAIGASPSLRLNPAKVSLVNPQPAFSFGGENRS
jgi:hypothetical protein